jgi:hypothetical protein
VGDTLDLDNHVLPLGRERVGDCIVRRTQGGAPSFEWNWTTTAGGQVRRLGPRSGLVWAVQRLAATIRVMPTFSAHDGTLLSYRATGEGDPVVCLPGGPMQDSSYLGDLGGVSGHRRLVVLELRGTGRPRQRLSPLPHQVSAAPRRDRTLARAGDRPPDGDHGGRGPRPRPSPSLVRDPQHHEAPAGRRRPGPVRHLSRPARRQSRDGRHPHRRTARTARGDHPPRRGQERSAPTTRPPQLARCSTP